jgi:hypothetical protein
MKAVAAYSGVDAASVLQDTWQRIDDRAFLFWVGPPLFIACPRHV